MSLPPKGPSRKNCPPQAAIPVAALSIFVVILFFVPFAPYVTARPSSKSRGKSDAISYINADRLIRKETKSGFDYILEGNARISHKETTLRAARILVKNAEKGDKRARFYLSGGVKVYDRRSGVTIRSNRAFYDRANNIVSMSGRPFLTSRSVDSLLVTCTLLRRDLAASVSYFEGDLRLVHNNWFMVADRGIERYRERRIELSKNPMLFSRGRFLVGKEVHYLYQRQIAHIKGDLFAYLQQDSDTYAVSAQEGRYLLKGKMAKNNRAKNRAKNEMTQDNAAKSNVAMELNRQVLLTRPKFRLESEQLLLKRSEKSDNSGNSDSDNSDNIESLYTDKGVVITDLNNHLRARAGEMSYRNDSQYMLLQDKPEVELLDEKTLQPEAVIRSVVMERDAEKRKILAHGNVRILQQERKIEGEEAVYHEEEEHVIVRGEPHLSQGGMILQAEKIILYPRQDRLQLQNQVNGDIQLSNSLP